MLRCGWCSRKEPSQLRPMWAYQRYQAYLLGFLTTLYRFAAVVNYWLGHPFTRWGTELDHSAANGPLPMASRTPADLQSAGS